MYSYIFFGIILNNVYHLFTIMYICLFRSWYELCLPLLRQSFVFSSWLEELQNFDRHPVHFSLLSFLANGDCMCVVRIVGKAYKYCIFLSLY